MSFFNKFLLLFIFPVLFFNGCEKSMTSSQNLTVALSGSEIESLDPALMETDRGSYQIGIHIYSRLVKENPDGTFTKGDITEKMQKNTPTLYTFTLKKNALFYNNTPLTSQDVVFSLNRAKNSPPVQPFFTLIKSIKALNSTTVQITTNIPTNHLYDVLAQVPASIISKTAYTKNPQLFLTHPVGSGAFYVKNWQNGVSITLGRNPHFTSDKNRTYNDLIFKWIPNAKSRYYALKTGAVDVAFDIFPLDAKIVKSNKNLRLITQNSLTLNYLGINNSKTPFNNALVRKIIYNALNRGEITHVAYGDFALTASHFVSPMVTQKPLLPPADSAFISQNKTTLQTLQGKTFTLLLQANEKRLLMAQVVADELAKIGIIVKIVSLNWSPFISALTNGEFDFFLYPESALFVFPSYFLNTLFMPGNLTRYNNLLMPSLLNNLARATTKTEEERALSIISKEFINDMPLVPLNFADLILGTHTKVSEIPLKPGGIIDFTNTVKN